MSEEWKNLRSFPSYAVSPLGQIMNLRRERLVSQAVNRHGVAVVNLYDYDGRRTMKSLALLVAEAFVERPEPRFDTPINLNGDRTNCTVDNLLWRPRPFALTYNRQFFVPSFINNETPIVEEESDEWFPSVQGPVTRYGLVFTAVLMSCCQRRRVFPTNQRYRFG